MNKHHLTTTLSVLFLWLACGQNFAQTEFDGKTFEPMPMPVLAELPDWNGRDIESKPVRHSLETGTTEVLENPAAPLDGQFQLGNPLNGKFDEPNMASRSFSSLEQYSATTAYPARTTVKLFIEYDGYGNYVCSGTMIGKRYVLTAGHCVHDITKGGWADAVSAVPGYDNGSRPFGTAYGVNLKSWTGWTQHEEYGWDMALVVLGDCIGETTGWLGFGFDENNTPFYNDIFQQYSYPAEIPFNGEHMFFRQGTFDEVYPDLLYHYPNGYGGMSGSSYWHDEYSVKGVHSHSTSGGMTGVTRMNSTQFYSIVEEMEEWGGCIIENTQELVTNAFSIYPNPATDFIHIEMESGIFDGANIKIINATGQQVLASEMAGQINVSTLPNGIYQLIISDLGKIATECFIISR